MSTPFASRISIALALAASLAAPARAQSGIQTAQPIATAPADPAIAAALAQVSPARIEATITRLVSFRSRNTLSSMTPDLPPGTGINAAADWIASEFTRISADCGNCLEVKRDTFTEPGAPNTRITAPTRLTNVYAVLHGSDPAQASRRVLVTGHYDSRATDVADPREPAPGANDDASGVAVSLECARVLSKLKLPATLVFVAVAGEEQGLNGSRHLARLAKSESWQLEAVLNNDIVGGDTTPGDTLADKSVVRVFSEGVPGATTPEQLRRILALGAESDSTSRELARSVAETARTYFTPTQQRAPAAAPGHARSNVMRSLPAFHPVLIFRRDRFLRGGDHTSFNDEGFAAVRFTEWRENFNHQHQNVRTENGTEFGDLLQFDDFPYIANVARLNAAELATLAAAPGPPEKVEVDTHGLDNDTLLRWQPPAGAPAGTRYEVVWRDTSAPLWTSVQVVGLKDAGAATELKLPISKDNVVFAVRSVDPAGHRSPAVLPQPAR